MKKLLFTMLTALLCSFSYASSPPAKKASDRATLFVNDDGSATIRNPQFLSGAGVSSIHEDSDGNAICKLFGFGSAVGATRATKAALKDLVVVGTEGRFKEYKDGQALASLMCEFETPVITYDNSIRLEDGSFKIVNPKAGNAFFARGISSGSSRDAICNLIGFNRSMEGKSSESDWADSSVKINAYGRVEDVNVQHGKEVVFSFVTCM